MWKRIPCRWGVIGEASFIKLVLRRLLDLKLEAIPWRPGSSTGLSVSKDLNFNQLLDVIWGIG